MHQIIQNNERKFCESPIIFGYENPRHKFAIYYQVLCFLINFSSNFGIEIFNNQVVVAGGYAGVVGTINEVEAFDFRADAWTEMPSMGMRRSAVYLTRIDNHEIIEKLVRPDTIAQ